MDRVRNHTEEALNEKLDRELEDRVASYSNKPPDEIAARIAELEREWDIERTLELNASTLALTGVVLGITSSKKWLLLSAGVLGFFLQHAVQGWCPPVNVFRRIGFRTRQEIDREIYALKVLRGDFSDLGPADVETGDFRSKMVLKAVRS